MASEKNITMRQYNGVDYDTLYPKTIASQVDGVYSKDEILSNATKKLYGLDNSAIPDDVFALLGNYIPYPYGLLIVQVLDGDGNGVPAKINVSPSIGEVSVFHIMDDGHYSILAEPGVYTLTPATDYPFSTVTTQAKTATVKQGKPIIVNFSANKNTSGEFDFLESTEIFVPSYINDIDLFAVGGGASGSCWYASSTEGTSGGAGGYTSTLLRQNLANKLLKIIVGSGGDPETIVRTASDSGTSTGRHSGGKTSISVGDNEILSANGAADENGGSGGGKGKITLTGPSSATVINGNGGSDGSDGENGGTGQRTTTRKFGESGNTLYASGGGGAVYYKGAINKYSGVGTAGPGGGDGTVIVSISATGTYNGKSATTPGSGGGGLEIGSISAYPVTLMSGAGASGMVSLRW